MEGVTQLDLDYPIKPFLALYGEKIESSIAERRASRGEKGEEETDGPEEDHVRYVLWTHSHSFQWVGGFWCV